MKRAFVFEYLTGGGLIEAEAAAAGEMLAMGLAMRDAIVDDLLRSGAFSVSAAVCDSAPALPGEARAVRANAGEAMLDFVARQAALHDASWVVAPETGGLLAQFQRAVGARRWLGCDAGAIAMATSKRATLLRLAEHGIATPLAFEHALEVTHWVVKPDDGAGAVDTQRHASYCAALEDAAQRSHAGTVMVVEPWVEGEALSLSLLCTERATELLSINRQRIGIDAGGTLSFDGVDINTLPIDGPRGGVLKRLADSVVQAIPGLHGFVGIDLVWHADRGPVAIEVNPRVTCAYVGLSAALGRNLAAELAGSVMEPQHAHQGTSVLRTPVFALGAARRAHAGFRSGMTR